MASFSKEIEGMSLQTYDSVVSLYRLITELSNNLGLIKPKVKGEFQFRLGKITCVCKSYDEFVENAYGAEDFHLVAVNFTIRDGITTVIFIHSIGGHHISVQAEKNEIMRLVNAHYNKPSFNGKSMEVIVGKEYKITEEFLEEDIESGRKQYTDAESLKRLYSMVTGKSSSVHKYYVLRWDEPSNLIPAHLYKDGLRHIHPDSKQGRTITVREAARLQTFPDEYIFHGSQTDSFKMIGNAVPPLFAKKLAESLYTLIG